MNFVDKDGTTKVYIPVHPWFPQVTFSREAVLDIGVSLTDDLQITP